MNTDTNPNLRVTTNDVGIQTTTVEELTTSRLSYAVKFIGRFVKNSLCENSFLSINEPGTRRDLEKGNSPTGFVIFGCCAVAGTTACTLGGCYLDHSCSVITGQAILGCILGSETGRKYEAFLQDEIKKQDNNQSDNTSRLTSNIAITRQPTANPDNTSSLPPSYEELIESGAIEPPQVRFRNTNSST